MTLLPARFFDRCGHAIQCEKPAVDGLTSEIKKKQN